MTILENEINKGFGRKRRGAPQKYTESRKPMQVYVPIALAEKYHELAEKAGCSRTELINIVLLQADHEAALKLQISFEAMKKAIIFHQNHSKELNETLRTLSGDVFGFCEIIPKFEGLDAIIETYKQSYLKQFQKRILVDPNPLRESFTALIFRDFELEFIKQGKAINKSSSKNMIQKAIIQKLLQLEEVIEAKNSSFNSSNIEDQELLVK